MNSGSRRSSVRLELTLPGDRRLAENIIVEVQALAQRQGLTVTSVTITRTPPSPR